MGKFAAFGCAAVKEKEGRNTGGGRGIFQELRTMPAFAGCSSIVLDSSVILRNWVWWRFGWLCCCGFVSGSLIGEASQQSIDGDVFVECFPVEAAGAEDDLLTLLGSGLQKTREPCKGYSEDAAVAQVNPEAVFVEADLGWAN
jgi:hypothetical protein